MAKYNVSLRGKLPEDIVEKISAIHAESLKKNEEVRPFNGKTLSKEKREVRNASK